MEAEGFGEGDQGRICSGIVPSALTASASDRSSDRAPSPAKNRARRGASGTLAVLRSPNGPELDWRRRAVAPASDPLVASLSDAAFSAAHGLARQPADTAERCWMLRGHACSDSSFACHPYCRGSTRCDATGARLGG
jgi:hypothetical protein